jgi:RNA polymerase sigma-70 factor (ECF subfamily)
LLSNYADAEDVTQEVLLGVVRKLALFRGRSELKTWLHRMTVNAALQYRRRLAKRKAQTISGCMEQLLPRLAWANHSGPTPDKIAIQQETNRLIEEAMSRLPEVFRVVVALSVVEGRPNLEIGELLGLSLSAVKSRLRRGRLLMRAALAPHLELSAADAAS